MDLRDERVKAVTRDFFQSTTGADMGPEPSSESVDVRMTDSVSEGRTLNPSLVSERRRNRDESGHEHHEVTVNIDTGQKRRRTGTGGDYVPVAELKDQPLISVDVDNKFEKLLLNLADLIAGAMLQNSNAEIWAGHIGMGQILEEDNFEEQWPTYFKPIATTFILDLMTDFKQLKRKITFLKAIQDQPFRVALAKAVAVLVSSAQTEKGKSAGYITDTKFFFANFRQQGVLQALGRAYGRIK